MLSRTELIRRRREIERRIRETLALRRIAPPAPPDNPSSDQPPD